MKNYNSPEIEVNLLQMQDIVTTSASSVNENADDLGGWNSDWFAQNNG